MMPDGSKSAAESLPLSGYKVIELGHSVAAPYAGLVLAEMGAEVIKVERPGAGDDCRKGAANRHSPRNRP